MVKLNFDRATKYSDVEPDLLSAIKSCNSLVRVSFPLRRDDGSIEVRHCTSGMHLLTV